MTHRAVAAHDLLAARGARVGVLNVSCPLALDEAALVRAAETGLVLTYEDHNVRTGVGSLVAAFYMDRDIRTRLRRLGVTRLGGSGRPEDLYRMQSLDTDSLVRTLQEELAVKESQHHRGGVR
jgi:transketolase